MSFAPVYDRQCSTLIIGTYPSPKSREQGFYYGHPQNRFWPLMALLLQQPVPVTVPQKTALLLSCHIALWDAADTCTVQGASDASITDVTPNPLAKLCEEGNIRQVLCNGKTAYKLCLRYNSLPVPVVCLPSTSPANAAFSVQALCEAWGKYIPPR